MPDRKPNRLRIDAILNAIRKGDYDDKLADIRAAVDARLDHKRKEVLKLVQEVYGDEYSVTLQRPKADIPPIKSGRFVNADAAPVTSAFGQDAEISGDDSASEDSDPQGIESRSPIIGPFNPS